MCVCTMLGISLVGKKCQLNNPLIFELFFSKKQGGMLLGILKN